ncbi:Uncharacterized protein TCM_035360 [Theobroma cacao]|uniref:Uncharacterized protein n=1 Tax=Theobroma cacao TaxID=3641 RepID=A0A061FI13_THECC|nr:Uncharacterized protein TCM_035360 [Theobroma cacao]
MPNVKLMITYGGHWVNDTYKGGETCIAQSCRRECASNKILHSRQQMQPSPKNVVGPLPFANKIVMVMNDDDTFDQMDDDCEEDDIVNWNHEIDDDCESDYVGGHDDCLEEDKGDDNDIPNCNHAYGDVQSNDLIYNNLIADDNGDSFAG